MLALAVGCDDESALLTPSCAARASLTLRPSPKLTLPLSLSFSRSLASFSLFAAVWNLATNAETLPWERSTGSGIANAPRCQARQRSSQVLILTLHNLFSGFYSQLALPLRFRDYSVFA